MGPLIARGPVHSRRPCRPQMGVLPAISISISRKMRDPGAALVMMFPLKSVQRARNSATGAVPHVILADEMPTCPMSSVARNRGARLPGVALNHGVRVTSVIELTVAIEVPGKRHDG